MIRVELRAFARNMLPAVLASLAEGQEPSTEATRMRWKATAAEAATVALCRIVEMPAVPRPGEELYAGPYTEPLIVRSVTWNATPEDDEAAVVLHLGDVDFDVLADDQADAVEMFTDDGWEID